MIVETELPPDEASIKMPPISRGGAALKKLPIIGLLIGAVAAIFAFKRKKDVSPTEDSSSAESGAEPPTTA